MALNNDDIKQLIAILQRGLVEENTTQVEQPSAEVKKPRGRPKKEAAHQTESPRKTNKFDQMAESRMHREDIEIDKKLNRSGTRTPRRDTFQPLNVSCRVCGRTEAVDPSIIEGIDRYKCNKCASSAG